MTVAGPVKWWAEMPRAEGKWLAGPDGPLATLPESATWAAEILTLTHTAFRHLEHLGTIGGGDGRITWAGSGVPVVHVGGGAYELVSVDEKALTERIADDAGGHGGQ